MTDPNPLGTALHDRVRDEHPNLDELVRVSTRTGARIRRRRRVGASLAAAAGIAVIAVGVSQLGGSGTTGSEPGFATQSPTSAPSTAPSTAPSAGTAETTPASIFPAGWNGPVAVTAPGWECSEPADEKFQCANSSGSGFVSVNWRAAADRPYYLDPDKADVLPNVHTFVSEARGPYFATVTPTKGTTQADVDEVGNSLVWADR